MAHLGQFFSEETLAEQLNIEQMFILVDGVLPIEACLYYQVLPLFLEGSRLHLGMVNPLDTTASDYVRRIVSYLHYGLVTRRISSQALQAALSAYLKYSDNQSGRSSHANESSPQADEPTGSHATHPQEIAHNLNTDNQATFVLDAMSQYGHGMDDADPDKTGTGTATFARDSHHRSPPFLPTNELASIDPRETLHLDEIMPDEITSIDLPDTEIISPEDKNINPPQSMGDDLLQEVAYLEKTSSFTENKLDLDEYSPSSPSGTSSDHRTDGQITQIQSATGDIISSPGEQTSSSNPELETTVIHESTIHESTADPLAMEVAVSHLDQDIARLKALPPRDLLRELMARAMGGGIGRLYFERKRNYGRILWSQSGVLKSAVDDIAPVTFQALLNEFKRLTRLPLLPLQKTKQVELERFYNRHRVLLRFRFIPGKYGEQATLQVLRGAALQFYQQQQVTRIGQDAVSIAKQLQSKINELRSRIKAHPRMPIADQVSLAELKQMLFNLEQQVGHLQAETETETEAPTEPDQ
ncbi:MAG: hypothetical protein F6K30_26520 [Cyanothece sp. SIO2G6]|nr:hypothetical protein [Cyanothece sp. SIO2G6]